MSRQYVSERLAEGTYLIPEHMVNGVRRYVLDGIPNGSFLTSIFANDFMEAAFHADLKNQDAMFNWASFIYNYDPGSCHGSYTRVAAWKGFPDVE